jgi:hypothetical protein
MPIRMVDDPQDQDEQYNNEGGGGGRGGVDFQVEVAEALSLCCLYYSV